MNLRLIPILSAALLLAGCPARRLSEVVVAGLRCEQTVDPLGVDAPQPRLSWQLQSEQRGQVQTAYQVLAASRLDRLARDEGELWDSGRVASEETLGLLYQGRLLQSSQQIFWKVRVWDRIGRASAWSAPATWTMGVLAQAGPSSPEGPARAGPASPEGFAAAGQASPEGFARAGWQAQWITDPDLLLWQRPLLGYHSVDATDPATTKWVRLDLGHSRTLDAVRLHAVRTMVLEGLGFPRRFKVEAADDRAFAAPTVIADFTEKDYPNGGATHIELPVHGISARYVRITATLLRVDAGKACLALSQVEVVSGGQNIAVGAAVAASDSLEQVPWASAALTDGLGVPGANPRANATLLLRREFTVRPGLRRALAHVCGLGQYELTLNGARVGEDLLAPGWTAYDETCLYDTHDITALLHPGANVAGLCLAGGMYNVAEGRYVKFVSAFRPLMAIGQLRLEYADGTVEIVGTDGQWRVAPGPTGFANVFGGEDYDARREPSGWDRPGFNADAWAPAIGVAGPGGVLRGASYAAAPVRAQESLTPVAVRPLRSGVDVYDLGQNAALMPRLRVHGPAGAKVKIIPAELLAADGAVDRGSVGGGDASWNYTLAGLAWQRNLVPEILLPRLPLPAGRMHGARRWRRAAVVESLVGVVVSSSSAPAGAFSCSNELFNRIHTLVRWAQRSNLVSVLTDCPHREKLGWLEQTISTARRCATNSTWRGSSPNRPTTWPTPSSPTASCPTSRRSTSSFRRLPRFARMGQRLRARALAAVRVDRRPGPVAPPLRHDATLRRLPRQPRPPATSSITASATGTTSGPKPPRPAQLTPVALTATAFYYYDTWILAQTATLLGQPADAQRYEDAGRRAIRAAFNAPSSTRPRVATPPARNAPTRFRW
jgi:alpha-L-rhamnosidase